MSKRQRQQQEEAERLQRRSAGPAPQHSKFPPILPYAVQWGRGVIPTIEFFREARQVNERLNELWDKGHTEAQGRATTWFDIVLSQQAKL